jgi:hypothetical protein
MKRSFDGLQRVDTDRVKIQKTILSSNATTNRNIIFPDQNGTLATTNDLSQAGTAFVNLTENQLIDGIKTFVEAPAFDSIQTSTGFLILPTGMNTLARITDIPDDSTNVKLTGNQNIGGSKTFTSSIKLGSTGSSFSQIQRGTFSLVFTSVPNQGNATQSVSFANSFSSNPNVILTNQSGSAYSGALLSASGISTTGFTCFGTNCTGTVSANITVAYIAYN